MKNIFEARKTLRVKVRETLGLSAPMNKIVHPTYLIDDKEYFIVSYAEIEGWTWPALVH